MNNLIDWKLELTLQERRTIEAEGKIIVQVERGEQ